MRLLKNVHDGLDFKFKDSIIKTHLVRGDYEYYHYVCDGVDDRGWGCGYRTLQTICSWMDFNTNNDVEVPSIKQIQELLVKMQDKEENFIDSRLWIGSFEVCLVIDELYKVQSKIVHVNKNEDLKIITEALCDHFQKYGSPVMMGGDVDCSSKGIFGICVGEDDTYLLVVDPHYVGKECSNEILQQNGWVKWQPFKEFDSTSFYNLCLPQANTKQDI